MFNLFNKNNKETTGFEKKKFKISGMHCSSCALSIDGDLEDLEGVTSSKTSYAKAETEVEFDPKKIDKKLLVETIKKAGYTAIPLDSKG